MQRPYKLVLTSIGFSQLNAELIIVRGALDDGANESTHISLLNSAFASNVFVRKEYYCTFAYADGERDDLRSGKCVSDNAIMLFVFLRTELSVLKSLFVCFKSVVTHGSCKWHDDKVFA